MENIDNIMQLCRLCLVKEQVNVPIFGQNNDIEEISAKISSCLPVKVSLDDSLPKKICDDCSYKLNLLYVFRNTSINSEKQLYQWLEQAGISKVVAAAAAITTAASTTSLTTQSSVNTTVPSAAPTSILDNLNDTITKSEISVKQEKSDSTAGSELSAETQEYLIQQQKLPYQESFGDFNTETNSADTEEPARKKPRRAAASKPPIKDNESDSDLPPKAEDDSEEEEEDIDDIGDGGMDEEDDDEDEEEEDDGLDHPEFVDVPSTSAEEQPGPSGVNKDPIAAPIKKRKKRLAWPTTPKRVVEKSQPQVSCSYCSRTFNTNADLKRHLIVHTEIRPYSCDVCKKTYKRMHSLYYHKCINDDGGVKHECNICRKLLNSYETLKIHRLRHLKQFKITCDICGYGCMYNSELRTHIKNKHDGNAKSHSLCSVCGASISSMYLETHMKRHEDGYGEKRNFRCQFCTKSFLQMSHLNKHIRRMHTHDDNRRKHVCDICNKVLASGYGLTLHKRIHEGVKSNECTFCGKKFRRKQILVEHIRTHTGEQPYVCNICGRAFSQRAPLKNHLRRHTGEKPYSCDICNTKFANKSTLLVHVKNKHPSSSK